jgi:hypothetical protein
MFAEIASRRLAGGQYTGGQYTDGLNSTAARIALVESS